MGTGVGLRQVGYFDCAGGGQVVVVDGIAYIGHMRSPHGTSVVDVRDPKNCKELATIGMPPVTSGPRMRTRAALIGARSSSAQPLRDGGEAGVHRRSIGTLWTGGEVTPRENGFPGAVQRSRRGRRSQGGTLWRLS